VVALNELGRAGAGIDHKGVASTGRTSTVVTAFDKRGHLYGGYMYQARRNAEAAIMLDWIRRDWDWMLPRENQGRIHRVAHGPLKYHGDFVSCKLSGHLKATETMSCAIFLSGRRPPRPLRSGLHNTFDNFYFFSGLSQYQMAERDPPVVHVLRESVMPLKLNS
jgi:hypothetical protein